MTLTVLTPSDVQQLFDPGRALRSQVRAFTALGAGDVTLPQRIVVPGPRDSSAYAYAARLGPESRAVSKFGSVNPANTDLPAHSSLLTVLDAETGRPVVVMDGATVTTLRTAAASALAVSRLAGDASRLALIGTGMQAAAHLDILEAVFEVEEVAVHGLDRERARELAASVPGGRVAESAADAVAGATLVVAATTSAHPVLDAADLAPGTTVISVGSFDPSHHEVGQDLIARADRIVVDELVASCEHSGPLVTALAEGTLALDRVTSLGMLLNDPALFSRDDDDIVFYNSVGVGVQDAAAATAIADALAEHPEVGTQIAWV